MARRNRRPSPDLPLGADTPIIARVMIRVSAVAGRDKQSHLGREFLSPEIQLNAARAVCQAHGWQLDEETSWRLRDLDQSASRKAWTKRPGMAQNVADAKAGAYHVLIFYTLSRMARNVSEGLDLWEIFDEAGTALYFVKESIDTKSAMGRMVRTILLAVAEMQADQIAEYAEDSHALRADKGIRPPYLPTWLCKNGKDVTVLRERAAPIRRMVELRLGGLGYGTIARRLNEEGLLRADGGKWSGHSVIWYLDEVNLDRYGGTALYRLASGDKRIPNAYPAIVDEETLARLKAIQGVLRAGDAGKNNALSKEAWARVQYGARVRGLSTQTSYLLSSLLRCGQCGKVLASVGSARYRSYCCRPTGVPTEAHPDGKGLALGGEIIEDAVARVLRRVLTEHTEHTEKDVSPPQLPQSPSFSLPGVTGVTGVKALVPMAADDAYDAQDAEAVMAQARTAAASNDWRLVFLHLIEHVEAPIAVPDLVRAQVPQHRRPRRAGLRRVCRVTLRFPVPVGGQMRQVLLAPLYRKDWTSERIVLGADGEPLPCQVPCQIPNQVR